MSLDIDEHTAVAWQRFADAARFVPDPMILRAGEVFANGATGAAALGRPDMEVREALRDNIAGLIEFFDMLVIYDRVPLINYQLSFDINSLPTQLATLLGPKALPVSIRHEAYAEIKSGALAALSTIDRHRISEFGYQLAELDALRYDWRPQLDQPRSEGWPGQPEALDGPTLRAAQFLLGGLIFSGFAQASLTDHVIQPKRSRFFLALTAGPSQGAGVTRADEEAIFADARAALAGTAARTQRLDALPPVLPYLLAKAPPDVTAGDLLKRALDFSNTKDGDAFRKAALLVRGDGVAAARTADLAKAARAEALAMLEPYSVLADADGGLKVEVGLGLSGPSVSAGTTLAPPAWLKVWWNENTPFGRLRKTFRRLWLADKSFENLERCLVAAWARS